MRRLTLLLTAGIAALAPIALAQSTPYKVIKTARVGKTGHLFAMASEIGPPPPPPPAGTPPPAGGRGAGRGTAIPGSFTIIMVGR